MATPTPTVPNSSGGLTGLYFSDRYLTTPAITRIDPTVNFNWSGGSPDPSVPQQQFSVRWTGSVLAPSSGTYTFATLSDDGVRLWVNNQLLVDNWTDHVSTTNTGTISLQAGQAYSVRMEYYQATGSSFAELLWTPPGQSGPVAIPAAALAP